MLTLRPLPAGVVPANAELQGGTDFWKIMAQLHDQEPSMMYLIQAYGTLNRAWWNQHDISLRVFFFESLSRGLHAFHRRSQLYQDEVFVFAALLLAALEELREMDVRAGRAHVHAAAQIIESWPQDPDAWPIHTRNLRHFLRTAIAPGIMVTKMKISLADRSFRALPSVPKVAPSVGGLSYGTETYFVDALDAAGELHEIITFWVCPLVCGQRHAWVGMLDPRSVQGLLDTWHESFACLEHSSPASPLEIATRKLTKANYYAAQAGVAGARAQWTTASVERLAHIFTDTLELIEDFFEQRLSEKETAQATSLLGLIPPLFLVATCARESRVKQRAVALLQEHDRREGAWTARVAALVAGVVMTYQRHSQLRSTAARPAVQPWYQASRVVSLSHGTAAPAELYVYLYDISRSEKSEEVCKAAFTDQEKQLCRDVEWVSRACQRSRADGADDVSSLATACHHPLLWLLPDESLSDPADAGDSAQHSKGPLMLEGPTTPPWKRMVTAVDAAHRRASGLSRRHVCSVACSWLLVSQRLDGGTSRQSRLHRQIKMGVDEGGVGPARPWSDRRGQAKKQQVRADRIVMREASCRWKMIVAVGALISDPVDALRRPARDEARVAGCGNIKWKVESRVSLSRSFAPRINVQARSCQFLPFSLLLFSPLSIFTSHRLLFGLAWFVGARHYSLYSTRIYTLASYLPFPHPIYHPP